MKRFMALPLMLMLLCAAPATPQRTITLEVRDTDIGDVFALLGAQSGVNIITDASVKPERISLHLRGVTFDTALRVILEAHNLEVRRSGGVLLVGTSESFNRRPLITAESPSSQTAVIRLIHGKPEDVAKALAAALPEGTVVVPDRRTGSIVVSADGATVDRARSLAAAFDSAVTAADRGDRTIVYRLKYTKATMLASNFKGVLPDGSYVADDAQNAIVVTGSDEQQAAAQRYVTSMDVAAPQVMFEVRVADLVPSTESSNVGLEFGGYDLTGQPVPGAATYAFAHNAIAINARLNAMVSRGHAQILATPKLVTVNNKEADLLIGETYPVIYYDARVGGQQVQFVDVGVKLRLTPTIGADGTILAEMHPEYSAIQSFVGGYPVIANRKIDSTLRVHNDETIVLGGLLRDINSDTITKIPWLADIPVFGKVFQNREHSSERDEIVFLITPHILPPAKP